MFKKDEEPFLRIHFGSKELCGSSGQTIGAKWRNMPTVINHLAGCQADGPWYWIRPGALSLSVSGGAAWHRCNRWWTLFQISSFLLKRDAFLSLSLSSNFDFPRFASITCNRRLLIMQIDFNTTTAIQIELKKFDKMRSSSRSRSLVLRMKCARWLWIMISQKILPAFNPHYK